MKTKTSHTGLVKVSILSNNRATQSDPRLAWIVFNEIDAMYRDLKQQEILQSFLAIQNWSLLNIFHRLSHINHHNQAFQDSYKKCHSTYLASKLTHSKCGIATRFYLIIMITRTNWCAPISSSWLTECGGPILVRYHHSCAHHSSLPTLIDII